MKYKEKTKQKETNIIIFLWPALKKQSMKSFKPVFNEPKVLSILRAIANSQNTMVQSCGTTVEVVINTCRHHRKFMSLQ